LADAGHTEKTPPEIMNPTARDAPVAREKGKIADAKKSQSQLSEITKAEKTAPALPGAASAGVAAGPAAPVPASAASGAPVATPLPLAEPEVKPANTLPPVVAIQQKVVADDEGAIHPQPTAGATRAPSDPEFDHHKELTDKISDLKKEADAIPDNTPERVAKDKELKGKYRELREYESRMNLRRQRADEERRLAEETERLRRLEEQREAEERARREGPTTATYRPITENPFTFVQRQPFSTFSIDVDTASYANVRRFLDAHQRPPADAVRLEEMINYFPYSYSPPKDDRPFSVKVDMADAPWQPLHRIARVAIKGREIKADERPAANFTFLLDVSGSMSPPERLPLVKQALRLLVEQLREDDRVSIVTYAGESGLAMESTGGDHKEEILQAIEALHAGGSTNGAGGIRLAYTQAVRHFKKNGINRVILCTDGDFNVGMSSVQELEMLIAEKAKTGVFLSVLGVGTDNLHDHTMQTLADRGNGNYHYLDSLSEARKVLVDQLTGTLVTIAKDVKIQIEFNPAQVAAYRLIGYEKRMLATQDFNNDKKDAGEIGAGHTITALYEIVPAKMKYPDGQPVVDDRRYGKTEVTASSAAAEEKAKPESSAHTNESMTVKLRYKEPNEDKSKLIAVPVTDSLKTMGQNDHDFQFAAAVAGFGMLLRDSPYGSDLTWDSVRELARAGKGSDPQGWRGEFIQLIDRARGIYGDPR
jgi:secreted protein with Ig-like and vWFA domain